MFVRQTIATLTVAATTAIFAFGAQADQEISPKIGSDSLPHATETVNAQDRNGESRTNGLEGALSAVGDFFSSDETRQQTAAADFDDFDWTPQN